MWQALVDRGFESVKHTEAAHRRRLLAHAIGRSPVPVGRDQLRLLTNELVALYRSKTAKTVTRDVNYLEKMGVIREDPDGRYRADATRVRGMRPFAFTGG